MPQQTTGQPQNPQPPAAQTAAAPPPPPRPVVPPEFDALPIWTLTAPKLVAILKDKDARDLNEITLSYTFFPDKSAVDSGRAGG